MNIFSEKITVKNQEEIKKLISQKFDVEAKEKQYAFWELKTKDFVATFYNSSKFVLQGKNIEQVLNLLSENGFVEIKQETSPENIITTFPYIGTDESGKGDFFGPLCVSAVLIEEKNYQKFIDLGIRDSKTLNDKKILELALQIQKNAIFSTVAIGNERYNELYLKFKNLNKLLAWGHARVIENILEKFPTCDNALSDKFGDESLILNALMKNGRKINLIQRTKAESDIAVACASVVARATYVQKMKSLEKFYGLELPKGASEKVKTCAKLFVQKYGRERLKEVSKIHFKTYNEI